MLIKAPSAIMFISCSSDDADDDNSPSKWRDETNTIVLLVRLLLDLFSYLFSARSNGNRILKVLQCNVFV